MAKARSYIEEGTPPAFAPGRGCLPIGMAREAAAEYLRISLADFDALDKAGTLPIPKAIDDLRIWDRWELDRFHIEQFEALRPACPIATIYVVGVPGFVKIGITARPVAERIAALQTGCPYPITLIKTIPGTLMTEGHFHTRFNDYRAAGEWFRREGAVAEWINGGCRE